MKGLLTTLVLLLSLQLTAQDRPVAAEADVASVDAIIAALYDVISGPAGEKRDWDRFNSLFMPGARLIAVGKNQEGKIGHRLMSPEDYQKSSGGWLEENGFFESEIGRTTEVFGLVTHAFSSYQSQRTKDGEVFARGINSIQIIFQDDRYWITTVLWNSETEENPIPEKYLDK